MSALIRTETITFTVGYLVDNFTGRRDWKDYDPTKVYHIHKRNRAYVWTQKMVEKGNTRNYGRWKSFDCVCGNIIT